MLVAFRGVATRLPDGYSQANPVKLLWVPIIRCRVSGLMFDATVSASLEVGRGVGTVVDRGGGACRSAPAVRVNRVTIGCAWLRGELVVGCNSVGMPEQSWGGRQRLGSVGGRVL